MLDVRVECIVSWNGEAIERGGHIVRRLWLSTIHSLRDCGFGVEIL